DTHSFRRWLGDLIARSSKAVEFTQQAGLAAKVALAPDENPLQQAVEVLQSWVKPANETAEWEAAEETSESREI
ncbi:MAG: hypothetical protein D6743_11235, partial [Calditrichaeota bacterium]